MPSTTLGDLLERILDKGVVISGDIKIKLVEVELLIPFEDGARLAELHEFAGDLRREDTPDGVHVWARLPRALAARYERFALVPGRA